MEDLFHEEPLIEDEHDAVDNVSTTPTGSSYIIIPSTDEGVDKPDIEDDTFVKETEKDELFVPPDGGYGWVVAFGAFLALFWAAGMIKSYGILFSEILILFPDASVTLASWIPASMTTLALAMAPIASALCQKFNCRYVTFLGSIICALGISLSSLATGVPFLFVTFGIFTGIGVGLCTTPGIILTARYFNKNRTLANMFCLSGSAAGSFIIPFLIQALIKWFGFRGSVLVLGGCVLHICISASLYRPLNVHAVIQKKNLFKHKKEEQPMVPKQIHNHHHVHNGVISGPTDLIAVQNKLKSLSTHSLDSINSSISCASHQHHHSHNHFKSSFSSLACSLPPLHLDHHGRINGGTSTSTSKFTSREELYWPEGSPRVTCPKRPDSATLLPQSNQEVINNNPKPLTLRELYKHQIGSRLSLYKNYLMGLNNIESSKVENVRRNHRSKKSLSMMFSIEDMMTDSTCILKDVKHHHERKPSIIVNYQKNNKNLNRSVSCAVQNKSVKKRSRYYSRRGRYRRYGNSSGQRTTNKIF